ncbi:CBS domain-containing protein [Streptomyces sp. NBC_01387]|uniref:CBS domain-containing protein n=1 Tax=unclassified Streptomyces TaxID=2593676 RepID=UPI002024F61F|nr:MULTISPECIES: CBS domain-containing protein [unclassified Streptomyces]MCX4547768.1 CBS domain-containing protein [Streptomyces sp. NBC_01500]WSV53473.1 CBS domain-containing protein [Streptomyces sp. NBC_01014]
MMSTDVVRVQRGTFLKEIARLLAEHHISAVPVVDDEDRPVGVVSEADLLRKQLGLTALLPAFRQEDDHHQKTEATTAEGLMTSPAVVAHPDWTIVEAGWLMQARRVKRLPVVDGGGRLVGVISRSDLLHVFLRRDRAIQEEVLEGVLTRTLGLSPSAITVDVADGHVTLSGVVDRRSVIPTAVRLCRGVDGVVDVSERLTYDVDDSRATDDSRTPHERP